MGITLHPYTRNAATRYHGESCEKEADETLTPLNNPSDDWPSLVKVTGLSESEGTTTGQCELVVLKPQLPSGNGPTYSNTEISRAQGHLEAL